MDNNKMNEVKDKAVKVFEDTKNKIKPSILKKIIKVVKILLITFVSLAILILVVGKIVLSSEKLQEKIKLEASNTIGKEIKFESISPTLIGIKLYGFELSKGKTFDGSGSLVKIARLVVKIDILPLLTRRISVDTFILDGFEADFARNKDGTFRDVDLKYYTDMQKKAASKPSAKEGEKKKEFTFSVNQVAIKNFNLTFTDDMLGMKAKIIDLNLKANYSMLTNSFSNSASLNLFYKDKEGQFEFPLKTKGQLKLNDDYTLNNIDSFIKVGEFLTAGVEANLEKMDVVKINNVEVSLNKIATKFPRLKEYKLGGEITADMKYYIQTHQGKGKIVFDKVSAFAQGYNLQDLSGTIKGDKRKFVSEDMQLTVNDNTLHTPFTLQETPSSLSLDIQANSDLILVDKLLIDSPKKEAKKKSKKEDSKSSKDQEFVYNKIINFKVSSDIKKIEGKKLSASKFNLNGDITNVNHLDKANGYMKFSLGSGVLNAEEFYSNSAIVRIIMMPIKLLDTIKLIKIPDLKNLIYDSASGDFVFNNGVMTINNSDFLSKKLSMKTTGIVNFKTEALDLMANTYLSELGKSQPIEVAIKGTIDDPKVNMNALSVLKGITRDNSVMEGAGDVTHQVTDELKKGLGKINIFGK
ncbi:MAG: AsmA family protein [Elusimicrobiaceae bacterium]|nr:AsmA family protein [Elusimicrobiaceae bacterium]